VPRKAKGSATEVKDTKRSITFLSLERSDRGSTFLESAVLDSTPLYDAVATMDTVTLIRSAIRGLLKVSDPELAFALRGVLKSGDDYASSGKPMIDWDESARTWSEEGRRAPGTVAVGGPGRLLVVERRDPERLAVESRELGLGRGPVAVSGNHRVGVEFGDDVLAKRLDDLECLLVGGGVPR
jgi:hypothetical protein